MTRVYFVRHAQPEHAKGNQRADITRIPKNGMQHLVMAELIRMDTVD